MNLRLVSRLLNHSFFFSTGYLVLCGFQLAVTHTTLETSNDTASLTLLEWKVSMTGLSCNTRIASLNSARYAVLSVSLIRAVFNRLVIILLPVLPGTYLVDDYSPLMRSSTQCTHCCYLAITCMYKVIRDVCTVDRSVGSVRRCLLGSTRR